MILALSSITILSIVNYQGNNSLLQLLTAVIRNISAKPERPQVTDSTYLSPFLPISMM